MQPPSSMLGLVLAASVVFHARAQPITARVYGQGADYFEDDMHDFKCLVEPVDGSAPFNTACSREQAAALVGTVAELELGPATEESDPFVAANEARLGIVRPTTQIDSIKSGARRDRRTVPDGNRSILIMLTNYLDALADQTTEATVRSFMQNPSSRNDLTDHLFDSSYGRIQFPAEDTTIITINMTRNVTNETGCPFLALSREVDAVVQSQHPNVNPADYTHKSYFIPTEVPGCGWGGLAYVNSCPGDYCKSWMRSNSGTTLTHEVGHNLGVVHAASDLNEGGSISEYGDRSDVMGRGGWARLNAPHRAIMNYLTEANGGIQVIGTDCPQSTRVYNVSRLGLEPGTSSYPNMLSFDRAPGEQWKISFRSINDNDGSTVHTDARNKVSLHYHDGRVVNSHIVKFLAAGESYTNGLVKYSDGSSGDLIVRVDAIYDNHATVFIDMDCSTEAPTNPGDTPEPTAAPTIRPQFQGQMHCGDIKTGSTAGAGSFYGNSAADHYWEFTLAERTTVTFDACSSGYDTWIRLLARGFTSELAGCDDCGECTSRTRTRLVVNDLDAGTYSLLLEGYSSSSGNYNMQILCDGLNTTSTTTTLAPTTSGPTTSEPTTSGPTTSEPTTSEPTTNTQTSAPTPSPIASEPTTSEPTTSEPTTSEPTTSEPTTSEPTTSEPTTSEPTTSEPTTSEPTTSEPTTSEPTTSEPTTSEPTSVTCVDQYPLCSRWMDMGHCIDDEHNVWMNTNCPASCFQCPDDDSSIPGFNIDVPGYITGAPTPGPTSAPSSAPTSGCRMVTAGKSSFLGDNPTRCVAPALTFSTRCCSSTNDNGRYNSWSKRSSECPWAESDNFGGTAQSCHQGTFAEAEANCAAAGARLCTIEELSGLSCVAGTGCGFDRHSVWTSSPAPPGVAPGLAANFLTTTPEPFTTMEITGGQTTIASQPNGDQLSGFAASGDTDSGTSTGTIVGIVFAVIFILILMGIIGILVVRNNRAREQFNVSAKQSAAAANPIYGSENFATIDRERSQEEEVFQLSEDGKSIRLKSVVRGNPSLRLSGVEALAEDENMAAPVRSDSYGDSLEKI